MKYSEIRRVILIFLSFILIGLLAVLVAINKDLIGLAVFFIILTAVILKIVEIVMVKCTQCKRRPVSLLKNFPDICPHCGEEL